MSADFADVARIQDEDVLRRMWQETDDFGRKKEIRSHMYKLREARLKEFYNTTEGNTIIQRTTQTSSDNSAKSNMSTHADSLADQSYVTLKSKEVRDSESPTRDGYNKSMVRHQDQGWTITSSNEKSTDGKTHTSTHAASTSGTKQIDGGKLDYMAKLQESASVFQDGDDRNFTKAVGTSSNSAICQEASGGDENSNFKSSSTKTSSSSRYVSESRSTNEDIQALPPTTRVTREENPYSYINEENAKSVVEKTYTTNAPSDLKKHPIYVEGKTKVTQETRTLADGTIVTTTRYETKHGNSTETATHKKYSNIASTRAEQRSTSSSTHVQSNRNVANDSRLTVKNDLNAIEYVVKPGSTVDINVVTKNKNDVHRQYQDRNDTNLTNHSTSHQTTKVVKETSQNEQFDKQSSTDVRENRRTVKENVDYIDIVPVPVNQNTTTTRTTVTKTTMPEQVRHNQRVVKENVEYVNVYIPTDQDSTTKTTTTEYTQSKYPREPDVTYQTTATHTVDQKQQVRDSKKVVSDQFISTERQQEVDNREYITRPQEPLEQYPREPQYASPKHIPSPCKSPYSEPERHPKSAQEPYSQPERRQPIKPGKSEMDQKLKPTEGQYDTTYRTEFTNKKISVEVSPTHDAFARSLRAVTPERIIRGTPRTGSNTSLRSSTSPEKHMYHSRTSPDRHDRSTSPRKSTDRFSSTETITYKTNKPSPTRTTPDRRITERRIVNGDTNISTTKKTHHYSTDTITKKSHSTRDENISDSIDSSTLTRKKNKPRASSPTGTTTSDFEYIKTTDLDEDYLQTTEEVDNKITTKKQTRPSTLEITEKRVKKVNERSSISPVKDLSSPKKSPTKDRSPTKEDRPKLIRTDTYEERVKQILGLTNENKETRRSSLERRRSSLENRRSSLERNSIKRSSLRETHTRTTSSDELIKRTSKTSPTKDIPRNQYPDKRSPTKDITSPVRKSPEKKTGKPYPERTSPSKTVPESRKSPEKTTNQKYPSQTRTSPEKEPFEKYPERKSPTKSGPSVSEFPSQVRRSPEREPLEPYPERKSPTKSGPTVSEFPSQIRRSPEREPLEPYPERKSPTKYEPSVKEFPSQTRRSPEREPLEPYPERKSPTKSGPSVCEFPSQIRRSPEREPLEPYPERKSPTKTGPTVSEFPSQIRRSPEREPLEPYPERKSPTKYEPSVREFPSQTRRSPEREPLEPYPERKSPTKSGPSVSEFPSQIRRSPEREPLEPYPERKSPTKFGPTVSEFPSQISRSPKREPLEPYPDRKSPTKYGPSVNEFPSQTRKSPEREPLEPYPERKSPTKSGPSVCEFPSQIRTSPEREPLEPYPEKKSPTKSGPTVSEFPSQTRRSPEREPLEPYPERKSPTKYGPSVTEFPSQTRRSPDREPLEQYPEKKSPTKSGPTVSEFPSQIRRSPEKEPLEPYPEKKSPTKSGPSVAEFPSQIRKSPEREPSEPYPERKSPERKPTKIYPEKESPITATSQTIKTSKKNIVENHKEIKSSTKQSSEEHYRKTGKKVEVRSNKQRTLSTSSTSSEDEEQIEEIISQTTQKTLESRTPISEPIVEKKIFSQLCREDEVTRLDKKKTTEELIEAEILQNYEEQPKRNKPITNGIPKKQTSRKTINTDDVVKTSTKDIKSSSIKTETVKEKSTVKRPVEKTPSKKKIETTTQITKKDSLKPKSYQSGLPTPKKQSETIYRVEKTKFITNDQDEVTNLGRTKKEPVKKPSKSSKTSLYDVENIEDVEEDTSIHLRTNRVDEAVTKKKVSKTVIVNKDLTKTKPKAIPVKQQSPIKKIPVNVTKPIEKVPDTKPKSSTTTQSRYSTTLKKTVVQNDDKLKKVKPIEPKKHVVTTTFTVTPKTGPKTKPTTQTTSSKTTKTTRTSTVKSKSTPKKIYNGDVSSDTDDDSVVESMEGSFIDLTEERNQFVRSSTDQTFTSTPKGPTRTSPKRDMSTDENDTNRRKVVTTTKTVLITNNNAPDREFIVNLQRSKSSREPTPDRLCPRPLTSDEEEDYSSVRYPDQISEPDDGSLRRKPKKLSDLPIFETDDHNDYTRITEVTDSKTKISSVDRVEDTDESLLSVNKKIDKFLNTADQLIKEPLKPKPGKVERPTLEVSEDLQEDECLLSVSDKVHKFITTSEKLSASKLPDRSKSPRPKTYDEEVNVSIHKKVDQFTTTIEEANKPKKMEPAPKISRPDMSNVDDSLKEDECLLSVSDKVNKFITTAEKLTSTSQSKPVSLSKIEVQPTMNNQRPQYEERSPDSVKQDRRSPSKTEKLPDTAKPDRRSPSKMVTTEFIEIEKNKEISNRRSPSLSPERQRRPSPESKSPTRQPQNNYSTTVKTEITETKHTTGENVPKDSTPKSTRKPSQEDTNVVLSTTSRLRSTESVKKAKALFEKIGNETEKPRQIDILSRPSVFDEKRRQQSKSKVDVEEKTEITTRRSTTQKSTDDSLKSTKLVETATRRSQSPQKSPERPTYSEKIEITRFRSKSPEKIPDIVTTKPRSREASPSDDMPHYMKPLDRSLRPNSPHRDGVSNAKPQSPSLDQDDTRQTKFGVTLRRTDSGRTSKTTEATTVSTERRKSSITLEKRITEEEIDEIFEIEVLEELLEKIVGYDLRRKIRAQIRLVKKLISENTLEEYIEKRRITSRVTTTKRGSSPSKTLRPEEQHKPTEHPISYTRKVSPDRNMSDRTDRRLLQHTDVIDRRSSVETTEYQSSYSFNERHSSVQSSKTTRKSPSPMRDVKSPQRITSSPKRETQSPHRSSPDRRVSTKVDVTPSGRTTTVRTTETTPGGVKTTTTKTTENKTFTTLKKTVPSTKKPVEDSQQEWVRQRNLRNTKESTVSPTKKVSTSTSTSTVKKSTIRSSPAKEVKPTDIITSSYGVGPTDENGTPLFGLRALRAQNKNETTKVQGTVITSQFYSENDQEPVGQVSVTKYSTDPRDLDQGGVVSNGKITSVTTTQKFGHKDTPSLRSLSDNKKEICDTTEKSTTKTTKLNRRGSVKEISKKFIDNAVETLKRERQTTYPKAGLILRTSSFKSNGEPHSREASPDDERETSSVTVRTMKTSTTGETFLTNTSKISGAQDVITRMKTEEYQEGDTEEDIAARGLLNKFIGSQVLLSAMESRASSTSSKTLETASPGGTVRRSTKITTTVTEGGKPTTSTRVFQRPVTEKELETVWDEQTLRVLLEQSTDYEERRIVRIRLRQVMAEQEACTALVDEATKSEESTTPTTPTIPGQLEGESQLLPLLQGLLAAPENDITPDSGTESGEDQRSNLIAEVQCALEKLSNSLRSDQTDITPERRSSLLQLVTKLQAGLSGNNAAERRASSVSSGGRFQKRKNKQSRHTVGVSKEELADARKLIEQISLNELTPSGSNLSKQNSDSSVPTSSTNSSYRNIQQARVKNVTAKPFSSSNSTSSSVPTPTEHFDGFDVLFGEDKDKDIICHEAVPIQQKATPTYASTVKQTKLDRNSSIDPNLTIKSAYKAVQQAAALKREQSKDKIEGSQSEEEEEESTTLKGASDLENATLKNNPIYTQPTDSIKGYEEKSSRFDTQKRLRMKRANTIDIPKPINFYEDDDESDSDHENEAQKRRDKYYALRGPINVSNPQTKKIVPSFEPKTESDKKFLAFINNHNENSTNKNSIWANNSSVWGSRFGNIKNTFEKSAGNNAKSFWKSADDGVTKSSSNQFGPKISRRSARNLQQMFEEKQKEGQRSVPEPKHSFTHVGQTNPQQPNNRYQQSNIVTGSLQLKTVPEKNYRVVPQPLPVNQFSHAPQSAFKPIQKAPQSPSKRTSLLFSPDGGEILKSEIKSTGGPAFLYSPKPLTSSLESSAVTSPVTSKPWAANTGTGRVLSMAASKFEQPPIQEHPKPRKLSKDVQKVFMPNNQITSNVIDRAPSYLGKSVDNKSSTVRKLSGQYENMDQSTGEYHHLNQPKPQSYLIKTSVVESQYTTPNKQYTPPVQSTTMAQPQNYTIRYDQPQNEAIRYDQPQTRQTQPQNHTTAYGKPYSQPPHPQNYSIRYDDPQYHKTRNENKIYQQPTLSNNNTYYYNQHYSQTSPLQVDLQPPNYSVYQQPQKLPHSPQNYSIRYDQPQTKFNQPQSPQNEPLNTVKYSQPQNTPAIQPHQVYQHIPGQEPPKVPVKTAEKKTNESQPQQDKEYTSSCEFKPSQPSVPVQAIEPRVQPKIQRQISEESVHEHIPVSSRVMSGPVSQQAVTVKQKSPMSRDEHDMEAAFSLKNSLQKVGKPESSQESNSPKSGMSRSPARSPSHSFSYKPREMETKSPSLSQSFKQKTGLPTFDPVKYKPSDCPKPTCAPSSFKFKSIFEDTQREPKSCGIVKPMQQQKTTTVRSNIQSRENLQMNDRSVVTGQFHIPAINVKSPGSPRPPTQTQVLSKSDSWHEICLAHQATAQKPVPKPGPVKSKSSHSLALPKLYEAGMSKDEMLQKRKTMEAFLVGNKIPSNEAGPKTVKRSINRIKTSQKVSTQSRSTGGLSRSKTLPDIICPELLDESNVDQAFDELFQTS